MTILRLDYILLAVLALTIYGFNTIAFSPSLGEIAPLWLSAVRFFLVSFPLVLFITRGAASLKIILGYGFFVFTLLFLLSFLATALGMPLELSSFLIQSQMFFTFLLAILLSDDRQTLWRLYGAGTALVGISIISVNLYSPAGWLELIFFVTAAALGGGGILVQRLYKRRVDVLGLVIWGSLIMWPLIFLMAMLVGDASKFFSQRDLLQGLSIAAVIYIIYPVSFFGYVGWSGLLQRYPSKKMSPALLLVPVFLLIGFIFMQQGQLLKPWAINGILLMLLGLCLHLFGANFWPKKIKKLASSAAVSSAKNDAILS
jgi:O-acetylserine/cysteine efflux transporter